MANPFTVPPTPTREQIEAFRREHLIEAHLGETPAAGLEPWAVEQNMVLRYLCQLALEREAFPPEEVTKDNLLEAALLRVAELHAEQNAAPQVPDTARPGGGREGAVSPVVTGEPLSQISPIATPAAAAPLISYIDDLFVSGNDVPIQRAWINDDAWAVIKECLADGTPLVHHVIEAEAIWRRSKDRIELTGDTIRRDSPLAVLRSARSPLERKQERK